MKKILHADIIGKQGINLIEKICLEMGFLWHPTGLEAGIDGYIEIRDNRSETVTNCIVQVQSKATEQTGDEVAEFCCAPKDLEYWLNGNAPVILIRSRPKTGEAYWVSIKEYFRDPSSRKSGKVNFDKTKDRFDAAPRRLFCQGGHNGRFEGFTFGHVWGMAQNFRNSVAQNLRNRQIPGRLWKSAMRKALETLRSCLQRSR